MRELLLSAPEFYLGCSRHYPMGCNLAELEYPMSSLETKEKVKAGERERGRAMDNLKPCPFCGSTDVERSIGVNDKDVIACYGCLSEGPVDLEGVPNCFDAWNTRAQEQAREEPT